MMNCHEFVASFFATTKIGAVIVPLNWCLVPDELEFIVKDSGSIALISGSEYALAVTELQLNGEKRVLLSSF